MATNPTESPIVNEWMELAGNESRLNEARELLLRVLRKRFPGGIPHDVSKLIAEQPSREMLHDWFDHALELPSLDDFAAYVWR